MHRGRITQLVLQNAWQEYTDTDSWTRCIIVINFRVELGDGIDKQTFQNPTEYDQMKIMLRAILTEKTLICLFCNLALCITLSSFVVVVSMG